MKQILIIALLFSGCAALQFDPPAYYYNDADLQQASFQLVRDYLDGQMHGEGYAIASQQYGPGSVEFFNVEEYRCDQWGHNYGHPSVFCRIKTSNRIGGVYWEDFIISFDYFPEMRANKDKYLGLRISEVAQGKP